MLRKPINIKESKTIVSSCSVCGEETFCGTNNYNYKSEDLHIDCFMKKYSKLKIDWNAGYY